MNEKTCRICLHKSVLDEFHYIFEKFSTIAFNIEMFTSVAVTKNDGLPEYICNNCNNDLETCIKFRRNYENSYKSLKNILQIPMQRKHVKTIININQNNQLTCRFCGKIFLYTSLLKRHLAIHEKSTTYMNKSYVCIYCSRKFSNAANYQSHTRKHETSLRRTYICNLCGKSLSSCTNLKHHLKIHTKERNFLCHTCGKTFITNYELHRHQKKHLIIDIGLKENQLKSFQCEICGRICLGAGDLKKHIRVHTNERPYVCLLCSKRFKSSSTLRDHERTHSQVKPFQCQYCKKLFGRASSLRVHERLHTGLKPYKCSICVDKSFNRKRDLDNHFRKHNKEAHRKEENIFLMDLNKCTNYTY